MEGGKGVKEFAWEGRVEASFSSNCQDFGECEGSRARDFFNCILLSSSNCLVMHVTLPSRAQAYCN